MITFESKKDFEKYIRENKEYILHILSNKEKPIITDDKEYYSLYFDGASRSNPGHASYGGVIYNSNNVETITYKGYLGITTNNVAEYMALKHGLIEAKKHNIKHLKVFGDSKLILNQITNTWKIKNDTLKKIYDTITPLMKYFDTLTFNHVYRKDNKRADELANIALDELPSLEYNHTT